MHIDSARANPHIYEMSCFLDALRAAARTETQLVLPPDQVRILLSDDVYPLLSRLEANSLRNETGEQRRVARLAASEQVDGRSDAVQLTMSSDRNGAGPAKELPNTPSVEDLIAEWLKFHVALLAAPDRYHYSVAHLKTFFNDERRAGRFSDKVTVKDLTPELQSRFREWRSTSGAGGHTVSRDLAALRGALTWAWKHQRIERPPPFIADVPFHLRGGPRDRVLSREEVAAIIDACAGRPDREHVIRFIVIELGTAGRPQAVLELEHTNIDLERNLINPNHPGRTCCSRRSSASTLTSAA